MSLLLPARPPVGKSSTFPNGSASQRLSVQPHTPEGERPRSQLSHWKSPRLSISLHSGWTETEHSQICIKRGQRDGLMVKMAQLPAFSEYLGFLPRNLAGWLTTSHTFSPGGIQNPLLDSEGPPLPQHTCVSYTYGHTTETKINLKTCA